MIELRFHGRAGQGIVTATELLATAAAAEGKFSQAFPIFGSEKRGPPVTSFCRISNEPIQIHEEIAEPDIVVVAEPSILGTVNVTAGLKENGTIIINTPKSATELEIAAKNVFTIDGTQIALKNLKKPITNTVMLGALIKITGIVGLESIKKSLEAKFAGKFSKEIIDANILTIQECFDKILQKKELAKTALARTR
ncbi:MAG: 2-oxoacid:acceptor oxidoreductase family protein [Candidatus Diapherotrites archaeon]|nr:2-oxoacid:acceptor oxidoreductase family protein [Candidatus Diapherotrites archaeon]